MDLLHNQTVQNVGGRTRGTLGDFRKFILRGNVVDLAVGIVIGAAFTAVVNAFVSGIITPLIPGNGKNGLSSLTIPIYGGSQLLVGTFINAVLSFLIVAAVLFFFVVKPVNALMALHKTKTPEAPTTRDCPFCLSSVPIKAIRCAYCTSTLQPVDAVTAHETKQS
ncbi:MAG: large conductance mechanosensitive channel protein MscL [Ktedonobacteraceae bacterium]